MADHRFVTANPAPRISASVLRDAATRLAGAVVLFVEDLTVGAAVYRARLEAFQTIDGEDLGPDDGTIVVLVHPGAARDLIDEYGTPGAAAAALNRQLRAGGAL
jgi:hypothetical protein